MLDDRSETRLRGLSLTPYDPELARIWTRALEDHDVASALSKLLFVPSAQPDRDQAAVICEIFAALSGKAHRLEFDDDLVTTEARVTSVKTTRLDDGLRFDVVYSFMPDDGRAVYITHQRFDYDIMDAAMAGWRIDRLERHWRAGNVLACRYRNSDPSEHAIESPLAMTAVRAAASGPLLGAG